MGEVTGQVTMDGEPLANALVSFTPVEGGAAAVGTTDASGNYSLVSLGKKGAVIGQHTVSVTTVKEVEAASTAEMGSDSDAYMAQATGQDTSAYDNATVEEPIPAKYNTATELTEEVTSGQNTINLELTSS
jgi:hypothetical protein